MSGIYVIIALTDTDAIQQINYSTWIGGIRSKANDTNYTIIGLSDL